MVTAARMATNQTHSAAAGRNASEKSRRKKAKAAALPPALRKAVIGRGAPWYASGVHWWNGTAETLKPSPAVIKTRPMSRPGRAPSGSTPPLPPAKEASWPAMLRVPSTTSGPMAE